MAALEASLAAVKDPEAGESKSDGEVQRQTAVQERRQEVVLARQGRREEVTAGLHREDSPHVSPAAPRRLLGPGLTRRRRGQRLHLPRRRRRARRRARGRSSGSRELGDPAGLEGRVDLPVPARPPAGDGDRRRRAQAVPLPRRSGARGATPRSSTRCSRFARALPKLRERVDGRPRAHATSSTRDARAGLRGAAARPRLLPHRLRGVRGRRTSPTASPRCARSTSRIDRTTRRWCSTTRPRAASGASRASSTRRAFEVVAALKRRRGGGPELLAYKDGRRGATSARDGHQRVPQGGHRRRLLGQGLPHLERDRAGGGRARGLRRGRRRTKTGAQARDRRARSRRSRTTSATRPRSAARPTSTRACSTPTTAG